MYDPDRVMGTLRRHALVRSRWSRVKHIMACYGGCALFLVLVILFLVLSGCCTAPLAQSTEDLQREFAVYQRAVVPHPRYSAADQERITLLGKKIEAHIQALRQALRDDEKEEK